MELNGECSRIDAETHQLLPSTSPVQPIPHNVPSRCASTSNASSRRLTRPDEEDPQWMPFALRWYFIFIPTSLCVVLAIVVMLLRWYSQTHNGLGSEDSAILGWKFLPTLIAVIYSQLTAMILSAVKRTEPFVRLAKPIKQVPTARYTLLEKPKPWWITFAHGFQKRRNGGYWSCTLIFTCMAYILAMLGISTLSAALLTTQERQHSTSATVSRFALNNASTLVPRTNRATYLRTTGAILQNYSTSPWVTNEYTILPFWPENLSTVKSPWNYRSPSAELWEAETIVFRSDLDCTELHLKTKDLGFEKDESVQSDTYGNYLASVLFESDAGCQVNLSTNATSLWTSAFLMAKDWALWTDIDHLLVANSYGEEPSLKHNDKCSHDSLILLSTPWWTDLKGHDTEFLPNMTMKAYGCDSVHTMAEISVRAEVTETDLTIHFDEENFDRVSHPVPSSVIDLAKLRNIYTDVAWGEYLPQKTFNDESLPLVPGAAALLGVDHRFNVTAMMADRDLVKTAARLRRRFFNEIVETSLQYPGASRPEIASGTVTVSSRRVLVNEQVALALFALLTVSFGMLLAVLWFTRLDVRPIGMYRDPSSLLNLCWWAAHHDGTLTAFKSQDLSTRKTLKSRIGDCTFYTTSGRLGKLDQGVHKETKLSAHHIFQDRVRILPGLRLRSLFALLIYVTLILIASTTLFEVAQRSSLHQSFFIYRAHVKYFGKTGTISPLAIIPTALAIGIALWWESIDDTLRVLQPFISMLGRAKQPSKSIALSYVSSFWIWASIKAATNRHWMLSLITFTTFITQILTVALSALFEPGSGIVEQVISLPRTLEPRRIPFAEERTMSFDTDSWIQPYWASDTNEVMGTLLSRTILDMEADWMYTAIIQTALDGPEPLWSKDDWSFIPLVNGSKSTASVGSNYLRPTGLESLANMTLRTPAIRARIECSAIKQLNNISLWFNDKPQSTTGNATIHDDLFWPRIAFDEGSYRTGLTAQGSYPSCCSNSTEGSERPINASSTLAYWTESIPSNPQYKTAPYSHFASSNFTIKWFRGPANLTGRKLTFKQSPDAQALNCMPIIETSEAEVTVDYARSLVHDYQLLSPPLVEDVAWSDPFLYRNISGTPEWIVQLTGTYENITRLITKPYKMNVTTSYGVFFLRALLRAACLDRLESTQMVEYHQENNDRIEDKVFNMRDNRTGMNADFMSYATYAQVGFDPDAMLDPQIFLKTSQRIFSTFFQHFVNSKISHETGSWAYQPLDAVLDANPPMSGQAVPLTPNGTEAPRFQDVPSRVTDRIAQATLSTRVEVLRINPVAFWISTSILVWIIITLVVFTAMQRRYLGSMQRNTECIADVLVLIAGSERLLTVIKEKGIDTILKEDNISTRLGWFRDPDGTMRWRVELVEQEQVQMQPIRLGQVYAPVQSDNDEVDADDISTSGDSVEEQTHAQPQQGAAYAPLPEQS